MTVKPGDLVMFKATGKVCVYLGMANVCYTFHNNEYGRVELSELHFNPENLEVL